MRAKKRNYKYGKIPAKKFSTDDVTPWHTVCVDCIGPIEFTVKKRTVIEEREVLKKKKMKMQALTMIDPATNWFEIEIIDKIDSVETAFAFDRAWLCRYPRPLCCVHDNGKEFTGAEFQEMLLSYGMKSVPTTVRNPQSNAVLERVHGVLHNHARTFETEALEVRDWNHPFRQLVAFCAFAIRSTIHTVLQATPGQIVFRRDMILPIAFAVNWETIQQRRQRAAILDNARENDKRTDHEFKPGDYIMIRNDNQRAPKYSRRNKGPYRISEVKNNATVVIEKGAYFETVNIRRIVPTQAPTPE